MASYTMVKVSKFAEMKFHKDTIHADIINENTLKKIIYRNRNTEFGKKYNFSKVKSVCDYKKTVQLSTYDDYEKYIKRMCKGEKNILLSDEVEYYGITSGTTGKRKLIPVTKKGRLTASGYMGILSQRILYKNLKRSWSYGRGLMLTDMIITDYTENGTAIASGNSGGMKSIKKIVPLIWTTPVEVMEMKSGDDSLYLHILFALSESNLMYIGGVFISSVLDMFRCMEKYWKELVEDIRRGRISRRIKIDDNIRKKLLSKLQPNPGRANFLENQFKKGFKGIGRRIWPKLIYIVGVTGGNFSIYDEKVSDYTGNLPVYSGAYAATEATIGINRYIDKQRYVVIPRTAFFEFIPVENNISSTDTKNLNELEVGSEYEIVVTSFAGLYRYRIGDVIKVVDYCNKSPEIQFLYRRNQLLNMVSEKTTEEHALSAVKDTFKHLEASFIDYTVIADNNVSPGRYVFFIESNEGLNRECIKNMSNILDRNLCRANLAYGRQRDKGKLQEAEVKLVKKGTFALLKNKITDNGGSKTQFKVPRVLKKKNMIEFMNRMTIDNLGGM